MIASELADKIATELAIAKDTGAFDTRCFTENVELIIAALRGHPAAQSDFASIKRSLNPSVCEHSGAKLDA